MKFLSIKTKIYIIFACFFNIPLMILFLISNQLTQNILLDQVRTEDLNTITTINISINNVLSLMEISGHAVADDSALQQFMKSSLEAASGDKRIYTSFDATPYIANYLTYMPTVSISLMDRDGYLLGEQRLDKDRLDYFFTDTFKSSLHPDEVTWSKFFTIEETATNKTYRVLSGFFPVTDPENDDELLGYVILYLDERILYETFSSYDNTIYILDEDNTIVSNQDVESLWRGFYEYNNISYCYLTKDTTTIANNTIITTQFFNRFDWQIVMLTPFKKIESQQAYNQQFSFILCIIFSFILAFFASIYITKPVIKLTKTMHNVDSGNLDMRSHITANDEIGQLATTFNEMLDRIQDLMTKNMNEQRLKRKIQLQLVQSQIKPHFLYNVLELTATLVRSDMNDLALQSINALTKFYRTSLSSGSDTITISKEFELTKNYLIIQKLRYIEFIEFDTSIDERILFYDIPKLTLQPFVENAIYHGLKNRTSQGQLTLSGTLEDGNIVIVIYDNGMGMTQKLIDDIATSGQNYTYSEHFGIANVIKRLHLFYGDRAKVLFESELGAYTKVTLILPIQ